MDGRRCRSPLRVVATNQPPKRVRSVLRGCSNQPPGSDEPLKNTIGTVPAVVTTTHEDGWVSDGSHRRPTMMVSHDVWLLCEHSPPVEGGATDSALTARRILLVVRRGGGRVAWCATGQLHGGAVGLLRRVAAAQHPPPRLGQGGWLSWNQPHRVCVAHTDRARRGVPPHSRA